MKTRQWLFAALTALLLAGCSTENDWVSPDDDLNAPIPEGMTQLSFELKGVRSGSSYAPVALTDEEAQLKDMIVVLFKQTGDEPQNTDVVYRALRAKVSTKEGKPTAAVLLDKDVEATKYYAVILSNLTSLLDADFDSDAKYETLLTQMKGQTYQKLFLDAGTSKLTYHANERSVKDFGLAMKALTKSIAIAETDRGGSIKLNATMTRPMARFDIKNSAYRSFTVTGYRKINVRPVADLCLNGEVRSWDAAATNATAVTYDTERKKRLNTPVDHDNDVLTPVVMVYTPAFYLSPGQATDNSVIEISGDLLAGTVEHHVTITVPLKTGTPAENIAIENNKRYKIELILDTTTDEIIGIVTLDPGAWDEGDGTGTDEEVSEHLPGIVTDLSAGTTYDKETATFTVPDGDTEFSFKLLGTTNTMRRFPADPGIIDKVVGTPTLAPGTTYTVTLLATNSVGEIEEQDVDGITVKMHKVNRTPVDPSIYPPTGTKATLVGNVYWAPVNVGATTPGEPGYLFQYGRMKGWASATAMNDAKVLEQIPIADADKEPDKCYIEHKGGPSLWWPNTESQTNIDALVARWSAVSDGTNNPCPKGWRLPTKAEADALLAEQTVSYDDTSKNATVREIIFPHKEYFYAAYDGSVISGDAHYWLAVYDYEIAINTGGSNTFSVINNYGSNSSTGYNIRCVNTKP